MWLSFVRGGGCLLAVTMGVLGVGCGQISATERTAGEGGSAGSATHGGQSGVDTGGGGQATLAGAGGASGGEGGEGNCAVVRHVEIPFPVQSTSGLVVKSGGEFAVSNGLTLAAFSWSGELARQLFDREACASGGCDALFGLTALRAESGWRLLSLDRLDQGAAARAWRVGDASLPEAHPLFGPEFSGLVSAFDLRPSRDGRRAVFANGHRVVTQELTYAVLDAEGQMVASPSTLALPSLFWDDLSVIPTEHAGTISVTADSDDSQQQVWLLNELSESGETVFVSRTTLPKDYRCLRGGSGCMVVEDAEGYYIALSNMTGTKVIGRVLRDRPNELVINTDSTPPGSLVAATAGTLIFQTGEFSATPRFVGLPKSGAAEPRTLAVTPAFDLDFNPRTQLLAVVGNSLFYAFQTPDNQVIEEVECPAGF